MKVLAACHNCRCVKQEPIHFALTFFIAKWMIQNHARVNTLTDNGAKMSQLGSS